VTSDSASGASARPRTGAAARFYVETLGCPKNVVDSDKVVASLLADGLEPAARADEADLVVVNTCAFIEAARQESIDTTLALAGTRKRGARLVVTGCMAERYGDELARALPEADAVVGFGAEGALAEVLFGPTRSGASTGAPTGVRDLLELPRPVPSAPWAYVKIAEGCDRACAFCAIPSFRGKQRSRAPDAIEAEARALVAGGAAELVLVAQDLAWYGRDVGEPGTLAPLLRRLDGLSALGLQRIRLLYLYPSEVRDPLVATMLELPTVVPYFDLSLQHVAAPLLRRMRRWGSGERFVSMIDAIRAQEPSAAFRSSFIVGFPGETELQHDELLAFLAAVQLDWAGFFAFSPEDGTPAVGLDGAVDGETVDEWLRECSEVQDPISHAARDALLGTEVDLIVDSIDDDTGDAVGRTHREAPEIDGIIRLDGTYARPGSTVRALVTGALGPDLVARPLTLAGRSARAAVGSR
jgi:ribosomal protein S12 methylthiotransferase